MKQYKDCDALLVHLGSLIDRNREGGSYKKFINYREPDECIKLIAKKNHPYLPGMLHFFHDVHTHYKKTKSKPLVLLSEFGEELRGRIRLDLIERLKNTYCRDDYINGEDNHNILPVDVGLDVLLAEKEYKDEFKTNKNENKLPKVRCVQCQEYITLDQADFKTYGHDEALFCVCKTCKKTTSYDVLSDRLRFLYEVSRELQTH